jgi:hypothetical protein
MFALVRFGGQSGRRLNARPSRLVTQGGSRNSALAAPIERQVAWPALSGSYDARNLKDELSVVPLVRQRQIGRAVTQQIADWLEKLIPCQSKGGTYES